MVHLQQQALWFPTILFGIVQEIDNEHQQDVSRYKVFRSLVYVILFDRIVNVCYSMILDDSMCSLLLMCVDLCVGLIRG